MNRSQNINCFHFGRFYSKGQEVDIHRITYQKHNKFNKNNIVFFFLLKIFH